MTELNPGAELTEYDAANNEASSRGRFTKALRIAETAVAVALVSPLNEVLRAGSLLGAGILTRDTNLTTLAFGATSLGIESTSAVLTADLLDREGGKKFIDILNERLQKVGLKKDAKLNPITKAGISYIAGSGVGVILEHREDTARSKAQNTRYGLKNAAAITAPTTAQVWLTANSIANPEPLTIGAAVVGLGAIVGGVKYLRQRIGNGGSQEDVANAQDIQ